MKIVRLSIVIQVLREESVDGKGLQLIIGEGSQNQYQRISKQIRERFPQQYIEALNYSLLLVSKSRLPYFISEHPIIFQNQMLSETLKLRYNLQSKNYYKYFDELQNNPNLIVRFILWVRIDQFKQHVINVIKKCKMNVPKKWIYKILGKDSNDQEGWIGYQELLNQLKNKFIVAKVAIRLWVRIKDITKYLLQHTDSPSNLMQLK